MTVIPWPELRAGDRPSRLALTLTDSPGTWEVAELAQCMTYAWPDLEPWTEEEVAKCCRLLRHLGLVDFGVGRVKATARTVQLELTP